ncbi:PREDICTED: dynein heavy chain 7, axonemal-like [Amphimedon queenslandica]|uniref:Uncharacterized protein n=1 Tax=Amphimedon queenslandica TaxID=400682 RepID=A0AAN0JB92_AMPQE|nr:PREDICTED: dynein heavy chain 7, axonemal-like [Amphimedon queenslandica]|eukprot:XP_019854285.1 PREDICTED: dynein heavy chain 7, axonemal-like [Amphimedon queenslandica]
MEVGTRGYNKKGEDPLRWLPSLPQKRTKPDWQDVSPEFKLFPGVTKEMIGAEQRPHTNTVSGLPSLLRPPANKGRQLASRHSRSRSWDPNRPGPSSTKHPQALPSHQPSPLPATHKRREDFRHALVKMIMNYPAEEEETADGDLSANEKDTLRYLYYIQRGIDTEHVAPMEDSWLEHVMSLLHQKLRTSPRLASLLEKLCDEMRDDYLLGVKKSIVDFVLRDPHQVEVKRSSSTKQLPHRQELDVVPKPWNKSVVQAYESISVKLFVTNPVLTQVLNDWYRDLSKERLIHKETLFGHPEPMELNVFQSLVTKDLETTKHILHKKWFPEVQNIFYNGNKRKQVPFAHLDAYFESGAVLMTNLLRELTLDSITEYEGIFCSKPKLVGYFPGFIISAVINGTRLEFEPSVGGFEVVVLNAFDKIVEIGSSLPRVESKLYPSESAYAARPNLHPYVDPNALKEAKKKVAQVIQDSMQKPKDHVLLFEKFNPLISRQAEEDIKQFLSEEHSFLEYEQLVMQYENIIKELQYDIGKVF